MNDKYKDIINMPHHVSPIRQKMSLHDRAAQFAPFAALTGYEESVEETGRLTDSRIETTDEYLNKLDEVLFELNERIKDEPLVSVVYFVKDELKSGGKYQVYEGKVRKIDSYLREMEFVDRFKISLDDVFEMEIK